MKIEESIKKAAIGLVDNYLKDTGSPESSVFNAYSDSIFEAAAGGRHVIPVETSRFGSLDVSAAEIAVAALLWVGKTIVDIKRPRLADLLESQKAELISHFAKKYHLDAGQHLDDLIAWLRK